MVNYELRGRVALITINRPDARNAVNGDVATGMEAAIDRLEDDPEVWVGVVTGEGPVFSAGADLKTVASGRAAEITTARGGFAGITERERVKPLIAAVNGPALAGGCEIVLSCDMVVAVRSAVFGVPEVKRALVAGAGGLFRLPRLVGRNVGMELVLTGEPLDAERAYQLGLVNRLVDGDVVEAALDLGARIAVNAPLAVQASRAVVAKADTADDETLWKMSHAALGRMFQTEDFQEGPRAFIEKRPPVWKGR